MSGALSLVNGASLIKGLQKAKIWGLITAQNRKKLQNSDFRVRFSAPAAFATVSASAGLETRSKAADPRASPRHKPGEQRPGSHGARASCEASFTFLNVIKAMN